VQYENRAFLLTTRRVDHKNGSMNSPTIGLRIASVVFAIFAIGHLLRLINHARVSVGTLMIPMGVSWIALVIAFILCVWLWRLSSKARG
jgi:uncharacterized membrane protein YdbT with pleckstrin-like domain